MISPNKLPLKHPNTRWYAIERRDQLAKATGFYSQRHFVRSSSNRAVWKRRGAKGICNAKCQRVISRANDVTVPGTRGMGYVFRFSLALVWSQTRPTCHNQLAMKADGEMRSPLGEQRWPVFRDGGGRLSSYRTATRSNSRDDYNVDRAAIRERASERMNNRTTARRNLLSASARPIQSFSRDFNGLDTLSVTPTSLAHIIRDINSGSLVGGRVIRHRDVTDAPRAFKAGTAG